MGDADDALVVRSAALLDLVEQREDALGRLVERALPDQRDQEIGLPVGLEQRPLFADQPVEQLGGAAAGRGHVDMRIGAVAHHRARIAHHFGRQVGVEIEAGHDRQVLADQRPDAAQQLALAVFEMGGDHCPV